MFNVNLCTIGGIISPAHTSFSSMHHSTCRHELESDHSHPTSSPEISHEIYSYPLDLLQETLETEQEQTIYFWKTKIINFFSLTRLCSLTFIPFDLTSNQTLFLQKDVTNPPFTGYFAPYLPEKKRRKWGCIDIKDCVTHELNVARDIITSLQKVDSSNLLEIAVLLQLFLQDSLTAMIGITFVQAVPHLADNYATHLWIKSNQVSQAIALMP
ncbi:MAG: hypothetical protein H0W50_02925 [Parachlamydiaceae bacterium]|nr:hypothetical protein [Parachlamydiaceae bacterium]